MIRKPVVAGQFYEADKEKLLKQIEGSFTHELGPGALPEKKRQGSIVGAIVPHAGYMFSGACAAYVYKAIAEAEFPDVYVILGPSHMNFHKTCFSMDDWETPLGLVRSDEDFRRILEENKIELIPEPHHEEHSIEVQLPFLQFISQDNKDKLKFIPILVADDWEDTAPLIRKAVEEYSSKGKKVCIITSSDFTHFGANYGYVPFSENVKDNLHHLDKGAIMKIEQMDVAGFKGYCDEQQATICGRNAVSALLTIIKGKAKKVEVLKYYTSGEITGDYTSAVGYASIIFK